MIANKKIGVALGSGSARGWSHIGVLQELKQQGIEPDVIAGCSVGSFVGAVAACGYLDEFESWIRNLNWREVWGLVDVGLSGGLVRGDRLLNFFREAGINHHIEDLPCLYGAVATALGSGQERWLRHGPVLDAVRASCTFPGLFQPLQREGHWLLDGGLVNPVPVSLCRAMGADVVIAVDLNTQLVGRRPHRNPPVHELQSELTPESGGELAEHKEESSTLRKVRSWFVSEASHADEQSPPGIMEVMAASINIMQDRISRSRMAGDPPDILLSPRVGDIGMMDFDKAEQAIQEGHAVVRSAQDRIADVCGLAAPEPAIP